MRRRKINLYNYVLSFKKDYSGRLNLQGVYHDNDKMIATDTRVMCVIKSEFPEKLNGKIVGKTGEIIDSKYPEWQKVIPKTTDENLINIDAAYYREQIRIALQQAKSTKQNVIVRIRAFSQKAHFEGKEFQKFLDFMEIYSDSKVYYTDYSRVLMAANSNGDLCLVMPRQVERIESNQILVDSPQASEDATENTANLPVEQAETPLVDDSPDEVPLETSSDLVKPKTDGIQAGTKVIIPAGDKDAPFKGTVLRCYELGPVKDDADYCVIIQLEENLMVHEGVRRIYPQGLMLAIHSEIEVTSDEGYDIENSDKKHCTEWFFESGYTLTESLTCNTGQFIYVFEPPSRQAELRLAVLDNGSTSMLYSNRGMYYSNQITKILINGYSTTQVM